jgi:hypothetical protein
MSILLAAVLLALAASVLALSSSARERRQELFSLLGARAAGGPRFWALKGEATWAWAIMSEAVLAQGLYAGLGEPAEYSRFAETVRASAAGAATVTGPDLDLRDDTRWSPMPPHRTPLFLLRAVLFSFPWPRGRRPVRAAVNAAFVARRGGDRSGSVVTHAWDVTVCVHRPGSPWGYCCDLVVLCELDKSMDVSGASAKPAQVRVLEARPLGVVSESVISGTSDGPSTSDVAPKSPQSL